MARSQTPIEDLSDKDVDKGDDKPKRSSSRSSSSTTTAKADKELRERLEECFARIADALGNRGDEELAAIFEDDADIMAAGLVSMTRPLMVLRKPLVVLVAVVEPLLSFGRVARVLLRRWAERRAIAQADYAAAQQEAEAAAQ